MRNEIGSDVYDEIISDCINKLDMRKRDAIKRPKVIEHLIKKSRIEGRISETLEEVIKELLKLRDK